MTNLFRRLAVREKQFVAWKNIIPERAYKAARWSLIMTDLSRIAVYAGVVIKVVMEEQKTPLYAFVVIAGAWAILSLIRAWARDQILGNVFATISSRGSSQAAAPAIPQINRPNIRDGLRLVTDDRDAPDFDDAPPPRRRRVNGASDRDAVDFDDAA